jgi:hypothetical protein
MQTNPPATKRELKLEKFTPDVAVVGGGLAGVCAAITAARAGSKVVLVQDRPVLGGNASSEVRLWILGATSHMGNNNRWAREGGVIDELLVENTFRNPEGNALILDAIMLEMVVNEPNITLLLNTAVHDLEKSDADTIKIRPRLLRAEFHRVSSPRRCSCDASGRRHRRFHGGRGVSHRLSRGRNSVSNSRRRKLTTNCSATRSIFTPRTPVGP